MNPPAPAPPAPAHGSTQEQGGGDSRANQGVAYEHTDENAVKDIETLMSELDILKARNTELEAENTSQKERIRELVYETDHSISIKAGVRYICPLSFQRAIRRG